VHPKNSLLQQLILLWHASDERGLRVSPLAVLHHAQLLSRWDQQQIDQLGWDTLMAVPVGCWPNANAAIAAGAARLFFFFAGLFFLDGPHAKPIVPLSSPQHLQHISVPTRCTTCLTAHRETPTPGM
jgi:hypothetical protein